MTTFFRLLRLLACRQILLGGGAMVALGVGALLILTFHFKTFESQLVALADARIPFAADTSERRTNTVGARLNGMNYSDPALRATKADDVDIPRVEAPYQAVQTSVRGLFLVALVLGLAMLGFGLLAMWRLVTPLPCHCIG